MAAAKPEQRNAAARQGMVVDAPRLATVDIGTLRRLRDALDGLCSAAEVDELLLDVTYLIDAAGWSGESL